MLEYMRTVLNGLKAWVTGEVNKLLSKIDNDIAALRKTLDEASSDFVINATITSDSESAKLDKTFAQIQEAINAGKNPIVLMNNRAYLQILEVNTEYISFSFASGDKSEAYFCTLYVYPDQEPQIDYVYSVGLNPDRTMPQLDMDADPTWPMEIATKKYVDDIIKSGVEISVQSDWNQNDETQPDYVKNRPFYIGNPVETVLVEESTVTFENDDGIYAGQLESTFSATVGETYKVSWDATTYECACVDYSGATVIGNLSIMGEGSDTGEPFLMDVNNGPLAILTADTASSHTISISGMLQKVVKIDPKYLPIPFKPKGESYLTFSSPNEFTLAKSHSYGGWDGTLEYFASDETWTTWNGVDILSAVYNGGEYVLYLRGIGNSVITGGIGWNLVGIDIKCIGNIENLLDYATVESGNHPIMGVYCYREMFSNCACLTKAPDLPATTLAEGCYWDMFTGCTSLIQAPTLPATTLVDSCYRNMFQMCTSLTQVPDLPATTLAEYCYQFMFSNCTGLKLSSTRTDEYTQEYRIPSSGNGVTANDALGNMFTDTGGTFTGTPPINTTYYLSSDNMVVRGNDIANLNGYVKSMIDNAECIIPSSTPGSTKKFKITVDDSGTISATEVTT